MIPMGSGGETGAQLRGTAVRGRCRIAVIERFLMKKRRLLFYNDSRHFYMYCYDPPIRLEEAWAPVDEIAATQVDTFVYCFGAGQTIFHDTRVGEIWGTNVVCSPVFSLSRFASLASRLARTVSTNSGTGSKCLCF